MRILKTLKGHCTYIVLMFSIEQKNNSLFELVGVATREKNKEKEKIKENIVIVLLCVYIL